MIGSRRPPRTFIAHCAECTYRDRGTIKRPHRTVLWEIDQQAEQCTYFANKKTWSSGDECPHWKDAVKNASYED